MDADERGSRTAGAKRLRLSSLLMLTPLLAVVIALGVWVQSLRNHISSLEQRVSTLESQRPITIVRRVSNVGIPEGVDRAMLTDGMRDVPNMPIMRPSY